MEDVTELQTNEDDSFYSLFISKSSKPIQLPEVNELIPIPTPPPPTPQQPPPASPTPSTPTAPEKNPEEQTEAQEKELNPPPPPIGTNTPNGDSHPGPNPPEEEEYIAIAGLDCWRMGKSEIEVARYNMRREPENQLTLRGWTWFRHHGGETLIGREDSDKEYRVNRAVKRDNKCVIDVEDLRPEDKAEIVKYDGRYLIGFMELREREKIQIVVENV